jgi:GntR family transcriptional regulator
LPYIKAPEPGAPAPWPQGEPGRRGQTILGAAVVAPLEQVREALRLAEGQQVVQRSSLILRDDEPIELMVSYWPASWAAETDLAKGRPVKGGTLRLIADLGWDTATSVEDVGAEVAARENLPYAPAGAAVLVIRRLLLTHADVPFEYTVMHSWDGHKQRYVLEVE